VTKLLPPVVARRYFEYVPSPDKKLLWENPNQYFQYYDDPAISESLKSITYSKAEMSTGRF